MRPLRVGLIGARRAHQGLGPFVARDLQAAGARVPCFLVGHGGSIEAARLQLEQIASVDARGYAEIDDMLRERLDAVAICSPHETHLRYLEAALAAGLHALCEKPLVWDVGDLAGATARIAGAFAERGLLLRENCQWGYVLPAFGRLFPGALDRPPRRFAMRLQPAGKGPRMLADALPHALSLLQALAPGPKPSLRKVRFSSTDPEAALCVSFEYCAGDLSVATEVELDRSDVHPRRVWLEIDGQRAERVVSAADYRLSLRGEAGDVPLEDPLTSRIGDFVRELRGLPADRPGRATDIVDRMTLLAEVVGAWHGAAA